MGIPQHTVNGNRVREEPAQIRHSEAGIGRRHLRQICGIQAKGGADTAVPFQSMDIKQLGAGCIGIICFIAAAPCQLVNEPYIHGSETKLMTCGLFRSTRGFLHQPCEFGSREKGRDGDSGCSTDGIPPSGICHTLAKLLGSAALPYNCMSNRLSRLLLPA